jgi:hypothetical protein
MTADLQHVRRMQFDHELLGRLGGYAVIDVLGTAAFAYVGAQTWGTPLLPTIAGAFVLAEVVHWTFAINTPLLTQLGVTFFPAPATGRHLNNRSCNCHS